MLTDLEIAQRNTMLPIQQVAQSLVICEENQECY